MAVVYRSNETTPDNRTERSIMVALGYTSPSGVSGLSTRKCDFSVRRVLVTDPAAATAAPNSLLARNSHPVAHYLLGDSALELVEYQALVSAHMYGQDTLLTIKVVQILVQYALHGQSSVDQASRGRSSANIVNVGFSKATECLMRLHRHNIRLHRALKIGNYLCKENAETMLPVAQHFPVALEEVKLSGMSEVRYAPHVGGVHL